MNEFDDYFSKKFNELWLACCCGDLVALKYKKALRKVYKHQQRKIDNLEMAVSEISMILNDDEYRDSEKVSYVAGVLYEL